MPKEDEVPTIPPPPGGDAYSAETTVRQAPVELLDAIRKNKGGAVSGGTLARVPDPDPPARPAASDPAMPRTIALALLSLVIAAAVVTAILGGRLVGW